MFVLKVSLCFKVLAEYQFIHLSLLVLDNLEDDHLQNELNSRVSRPSFKASLSISLKALILA